MPKIGDNGYHYENLFYNKMKSFNEASAAFIGLYGFKNPIDIDKFLQTPAGKAVAENIATETAMAELLEKYLSGRLSEQDRQEAMLSFLLYEELLEDKNSNANLNAQIQEQIKDKLKAESDAIRRASEASRDTPLVFSFKSAEELLDKNILETTQQIADIEKIGKEIDYQYDIFKEKAKTIKETKYDLTKDQKKIKKEIASLEKKIAQDQIKAENLYRDGKDDEAQKLLAENNTNVLALGNLQDMQAVIDGKNYCCDANGQWLGPEDYDKAPFIVPVGKVIIKEGNDFYLLDQGKSLSELSPDEKQEALDSFKIKEPMMRKDIDKIEDNAEIAKSNNNSSLVAKKNQLTDLSILKQQMQEPKQNAINYQTERMEAALLAAKQKADAAATAMNAKIQESITDIEDAAKKAANEGDPRAALMAQHREFSSLEKELAEAIAQKELELKDVNPEKRMAVEAELEAMQAQKASVGQRIDGTTVALDTLDAAIDQSIDNETSKEAANREKKQEQAVSPEPKPTPTPAPAPKPTTGDEAEEIAPEKDTKKENKSPSTSKGNKPSPFLELLEKSKEGLSGFAKEYCNMVIAAYKGAAGLDNTPTPKPAPKANQAAAASDKKPDAMTNGKNPADTQIPARGISPETQAAVTKSQNAAKPTEKPEAQQPSSGPEVTP